MARLLPRTLVLVLLAAVVGVTASPAQAARRTVPFGFFGTVLNPELSSAASVPDALLDQQTALMARSGVESLRVSLSWVALEPARGTYNWSSSDRIVAAAARHRLQLLANVMITPRWASTQPNAPYFGRYPPRDPRFFREFMRQLVLRYGPRGAFWTENPALPRVPIRWWQIWNEQMAPWFWASRPWGPSYTRLLRAAYRGIHGEDRRAKVVPGSLVTLGRYSQWAAMRDLYRAGARRYFDAVAIHPFTDGSIPVSQSVERVVEIVRRVRQVMRERRDGRKPVILTEVSWPAARGRVPRRRLLGLETTRRGQAQRLRAVYSRLARERRGLNVAQAYWFTWASEYDANSRSSDVTYRFAGLTRFSGGSFTRMPVLGAYARVAARLQGCRKSDSARSCR
jgi:hypothetical protein